eukprot:gene9158-12354_t
MLYNLLVFSVINLGFTISVHLNSLEDIVNDTNHYTWLSKYAVQHFINEFHRMEKNRINYINPVDKTDSRSADPFISSDAFRAHCYPNLCEYDNNDGESKLGNNCNFNINALKNGSCIFVTGGMLEYLVHEKLPHITSRIVIFTDKRDDQANPDGQIVRGINTKKYTLSDKLQKYVDSGIVSALHSVNLHWRGFVSGQSRPSYMHCVPIGIEVRSGTIGAQLDEYISAMSQVHQRVIETQDRRLLLAAFHTSNSNKPDRNKAWHALANQKFVDLEKHSKPWKEWLKTIPRYKFIACPHGHGLDTHRMMEVLLMGSVPVVRRSSITSCYDDSDNSFGSLHRGNLPIVVVNNWEDVTENRLNSEWERIIKIHPKDWDWRRLFASHWFERLDEIPLTTNQTNITLT